VSHRPHDEFVKHMLFDTPVARDFFENNLSKEMLSQMCLSTMILTPGTFVDSELNMRHTDILYKVALKTGSEGYIYLLVEHQSSPDPVMAFRTLNYVMRILDRHIKDSINAGKNPLPLPYIFPIVYYNGEKAYKGENCLFNLFGEYKEHVQKIFTGPLNLIDISLEANQNIRGQKWASLLSWCMRHSMQREFLPYLADFGQFVNDVLLAYGWTDTDRDRIKVMLNYIMRSLSTSADNEVFIEAMLNTLPPELEDTAMTIAEQLFQKGEIKGIAETLKAVTLINQGADIQTIMKETGLSLKMIEALRKEIMH
jgi:predicted transposase YdaD